MPKNVSQTSRIAKEQKEGYISRRQDGLRKDQAERAKRRLDFSLQQSCIFSHFGEVKEDEAKHQTKVGGATHRRHEEDAEGPNTTYGLDADDL